MRVWMLCEAFTLTGDAFGSQTVHDSLAPWCLPCENRKVALRELRNAVTERVRENYEGLFDADGDIESDVRDVMASPMKLGRGIRQYNYYTCDREICWRVYPCEVKR